jgi:hypothetical protein
MYYSLSSYLCQLEQLTLQVEKANAGMQARHPLGDGLKKCRAGQGMA